MTVGIPITKQEKTFIAETFSESLREKERGFSLDRISSLFREVFRVLPDATICRVVVDVAIAESTQAICEANSLKKSIQVRDVSIKKKWLEESIKGISESFSHKMHVVFGETRFWGVRRIFCRFAIDRFIANEDVYSRPLPEKWSVDLVKEEKEFSNELVIRLKKSIIKYMAPFPCGRNFEEEIYGEIITDSISSHLLLESLIVELCVDEIVERNSVNIDEEIGSDSKFLRRIIPYVKFFLKRHMHLKFETEQVRQLCLWSQQRVQLGKRLTVGALRSSPLLQWIDLSRIQ